MLKYNKIFKDGNFLKYLFTRTFEELYNIQDFKMFLRSGRYESNGTKRFSRLKFKELNAETMGRTGQLFSYNFGRLYKLPSCEPDV